MQLLHGAATVGAAKLMWCCGSSCKLSMFGISKNMDKFSICSDGVNRLNMLGENDRRMLSFSLSVTGVTGSTTGQYISFCLKIIKKLASECTLPPLHRTVIQLVFTV